MLGGSEKRASRRYNMALPLTLRSGGDQERIEHRAETRDVSFRGLYFLTDDDLKPGSPLDFTLTLPKEITMAGDVLIRCVGQVIRVDRHDGRTGVAARIERYEIAPAAR